MTARFYHRGPFDSFGAARIQETAGAAAFWISLRPALRLDRLHSMRQISGYRFLALPPVLVLVAYRMTEDRPWTPLRVAGAVLMLFGFVLWGIAHVQLGDSFSARAVARRLVTGGIYSRIRSPIYIFGGIGIVGFLLVMERPIFLLAFLVLIPVQVLRSRNEARVLEEKFGEEYRKYARHTWF
jgi:protein-S-isoprenylcysteine O-methyltransferase Ste14